MMDKVTIDSLIKAIAKRACAPGSATSCNTTDDYPPPPVTDAIFDELEHRLGVTFPIILRRAYVEIGNGGFGPGYGLLSIEQLSTFDRGISFFYEIFRESRNMSGGEWPIGIVPFAHWGDLILSCVDLTGNVQDPPVLRFEPNINKVTTIEFLNGVPFRGVGMIPESPTLSDWFQRWLNEEEMFDAPYHPHIPLQ